jgi:hypothetical protein
MGCTRSTFYAWKRQVDRHGLNTRTKRLTLVAGYAAPYEPPRDPGPERHIDVSRPGELVGIDFGRLRGTRRLNLAAHRDRHRFPFAWTELVVCKTGKPSNPNAKQTSKSSPAASPRTCGRRVGVWSVSSPTTATSSRAISPRQSTG